MTTIPNPTTRLQALLQALRQGERAPSAKRSVGGLIALASSAEAMQARKARAARVTAARSTTRTTVSTPKKSALSVAFPWGRASLNYPSASRLHRPVGIDTWAAVVTPAGQIYEVSETAPKGQRVRPDQVETLAGLIDAGSLLWDQTAVFPWSTTELPGGGHGH